jgi:hypothetical protein
MTNPAAIGKVVMVINYPDGSKALTVHTSGMERPVGKGDSVVLWLLADEVSACPLCGESDRHNLVGVDGVADHRWPS